MLVAESKIMKEMKQNIVIQILKPTKNLQETMVLKHAVKQP